MIANMFRLPLALEGDWADFRAVIVVLIGVLAWFVTIYVLIATNIGWKQGYLVTMVALSGWTILLALIWLVGVPGTLPGTGPRSYEPHWIPFLAESEQGAEFSDAIARFPDGWDEIGQTYPGNVPSQGQLEQVSHTVQESLRHLCYQRDPDSACWADPDVWDWRMPGEEALPSDADPAPEATVRFYQQGTPLLFGVEIPATDEHRAQTIFALRDRGLVFLNALLFLLAGVLGFVVHLWLLVRDERKLKAEEEALAPDSVPVS